MTSAPAYRVLARKYRPQSLSDLYGQDILVKTLNNAFASGRIAHAFLLSGIRGTGKTSTARIIARGLNCTGIDGAGGPTTNPCGQCTSCRDNALDRQLDVIEIDAASKTGVDDVRDIIENSHYRAMNARYKVYIIDEVHMLSVNAFNALLKTLEEPPPHVKFIFATTELQKIPPTVLSRCQCFGLRRIDPDNLRAMLQAIAAQEGIAIAEDAVALLVRSAEGSARDAISLLDQAISYGSAAAASEKACTDKPAIAVNTVRAMLGLLDRAQGIDLFDAIHRGDADSALQLFTALYQAGHEPIATLTELAEITHALSMLKITPSASTPAGEPANATGSSAAAIAAGIAIFDPEQRQRMQKMAKTLSIPTLTRTWHIVIKGLEEIKHAPDLKMAVDMIIVRLVYMADLPSPQDIIRKLDSLPSRSLPTAGPAVSAAVGSGDAETASWPASAIAGHPAVKELVTAFPTAKIVGGVPTKPADVPVDPEKDSVSPDGLHK